MKRYLATVDLAKRAKAIFAENTNYDDGKVFEGRELLFHLKDHIRAARSHRVKAKLPDDEGEISGD